MQLYCKWVTIVAIIMLNKLWKPWYVVSTVWTYSKHWFKSTYDPTYKLNNFWPRQQQQKKTIDPVLERAF